MGGASCSRHYPSRRRHAGLFYDFQDWRETVEVKG